MIGRRDLPASYRAFNRTWGAPLGPRWLLAMPTRTRRFVPPRLTGPFAFHPDNSVTRAFEYPWAFHATPLDAGMVAVDVGGSLGGLQFVLARSGLRVINVDPSDEAANGWPVHHRTIARLNRAFKTDVRLERCFLQDAPIDAESVDRVFSISTLEHIPPAEIDSLMASVAKILKPGGQCVFTVDLFVDLEPFTAKASNRSGTNLNIAALVEASGLELTAGDRAELNGYPEFDPQRILANLPDYLYGAVDPNLAQAFVLTKR